MSATGEEDLDGALREYTHARQSLARCVQTLHDLCRRSDNHVRVTACRELLAKLAEDRFTLAVVGQFKRGKSSLMNALLGRQLLPTGRLPVTSAITVLRYGPEERLLVARTDSKLLEEADTSRLAEFVTETGNPGNRRGVAAVYVELPHPFLRRGLEFVDTPGVGSTIEANTATTYSFLPRCDAVVFVTGADAPVTAAETAFLRDLREHLRKVFVVVNKMDVVPLPDREAVVEHAEKTLREALDSEQVTCFPVSSQEALAAAQAGNQAALNHSGAPALKEALGAFLATERQSVLLETTADKALGLCAAELREARWLRRLQDRQRSERLSATGDQAFAALRHEQAETLAALGQRLHDRVGAELTARWSGFAGELVAALAREVEAELDQRAGEQVVTALHWTIVRVETRLKTELMDWWERQQPELDRVVTEADDAAAELWRRPLAVMEELSGAAADGKTSAATRGERGFPPVSWLAPGRSRWEPELPALLKPLPVRLCRNKLRSLLVRQLSGCVDDAGHLVRSAGDRSLDHALHLFATELRDHTEAVEKRVRQALASQTPVAEPSGGDTVSQLTVLRSELLTFLGAECASPAKEDVESAPPSSSRDASETVLDLPRALTTRGCPVCDALEATVFAFFSRFQYELATSGEAQHSFAETAGFCPLHTWQLAGVSSPQGMSRGLAPWAERAATALTATPAESLTPRNVFFPRAPESGGCRVCSLLRETEAEILTQLAAFLQTPEGRRKYEQSRGVCLPHLDGLLRRAPDADGRKFLLSHAARALDALAEDMRSYALKHAAVRRALVRCDERDAWLRALIHLAGARNLSLPWGDES